MQRRLSVWSSPNGLQLQSSMVGLVKHSLHMAWASLQPDIIEKKANKNFEYRIESLCMNVRMCLWFDDSLVYHCNSLRCLPYCADQNDNCWRFEFTLYISRHFFFQFYFEVKVPQTKAVASENSMVSSDISKHLPRQSGHFFSNGGDARITHKVLNQFHFPPI